MAATAGNRIKLIQVETMLSDLIAETLRRGFHGKAVLEIPSLRMAAPTVRVRWWGNSMSIPICGFSNAISRAIR